MDGVDKLFQFIQFSVMLVDFKSMKTEFTTSLACPVDFYPQNGICVDCPAGTFGPACSYVCSNPYYGRRCLKICDCTDVQRCDPAIGCTDQLITEQNTTTKTSPEVETKRTTTLTTSTIPMPRTSKIEPRQKVPNKTNTGLFITFTRPVSNVGLNQTTETTTFYMENRKTAAEIAEKVNGKENSNPVGNFTNSVIISVGCVVILLLTVIIVVQIRSKRKKRKHNNRDIVSFVRERSSTYCEIDDRMVPSTSEYHRISDNRDYELIREAERERTKYSTLPTAQRSEDRNSYLTPNCKATDSAKEMTSDDTGTGFKNQPRIDVDSHYTALPTKKKASLDCGNNSILSSNATKSSASKEKRLLEDTEPAKIDTESPVLLRNVKGSRIAKASTLSPPSEEVTRSYIDMNKGTIFVEYESMENRSNDVHSHISENERNPLNALKPV